MSTLRAQEGMCPPARRQPRTVAWAPPLLLAWAPAPLWAARAPPLLAPGLVNDEKWGITHVIGSYIIKLQKVVVETTVTGFEPARQNARRFQVFLLNHSDILSTSLIKQTCFSINHVHYNNYSATYFLFLFGVAACSLLATPTKREMVYAIPLSQP